MKLTHEILPPLKHCGTKKMKLFKLLKTMWRLLTEAPRPAISSLCLLLGKIYFFNKLQIANYCIDFESYTGRVSGLLITNILAIGYVGQILNTNGRSLAKVSVKSVS